MKNIFLTYFPICSDIHLFKDPGQIPFRFKRVLGYDSYIITALNYNETQETKKYIDLLNLPKGRLKRYLKLFIFFYKNRNKIKILNLFHISFHNIFIAWFCKLFVPNVFIYLKMDNCVYTGPYPWEKIFDKSIEPAKYFQDNATKLIDKFKNFILRKYLIHVVNLFSVEDNESRTYYEKRYPFFKNKLITVYNGHVIDLFDKSISKTNENKENIILSVANLGTYSKATEILLEAFAKIASENSWELHLAGSVKDSFKPYVKEFFERFPEIKDRIFFHGHLNKVELFKLYQKAKIFCLPSRFEGFANVYSEAMYFKNAIITTKYVSPREIIENNMGLIIEKDDVNELAEAISYLIKNQNKIVEFGENAHQFAINNLNWDIIVQNLYNEMLKHGLKK